jgi:hypothetical protein
VQRSGKVLTTAEIDQGALTPGTELYNVHFPPLDRRGSVRWSAQYGNVVMVTTESLWNSWQPSQKLENVRPGSVAYHIGKLQQGAKMDAIVLEKIIYAESGTCVRTSDGRHRLLAAHELGISAVGVINTPALRDALMLDLIEKA